MALINCPECGKQISDKAHSCPYCGCPISPRQNPTPANEAPNQTETETVYFDGIIEGLDCRIASSIWQFGNVAIPVKSVSAIKSVKRRFPTWIGILLFILIPIFLVFVYSAIEGKNLAFALFALALFLILILPLFYIGYAIASEERLDIINNSGSRTSVLKCSRKNREKIKELQSAALKCLKECAS